MAEGLLPNSNNSRKKSKQKGFDVFRQPPPRLIAERHGNLTRPFSTSDSDSSTKSANSGALSGKVAQVQNPGVTFKSSAHDISSNAPGDINDVAKRLSDFSGAGGSYVTGSLREPVVAVDHVTSSQTLLPRDSPSNFLNASSSNLQLRKLLDSHVVTVPNTKSTLSGDAREHGFSSAGGRSAFSPVVGVSFNGGTQPPPRVPPRVPLQQKPFGKHHKRNSNTCSISGSNASINSAASTPATATGGEAPTVSLNELPILGAHTQGSSRATSSSAAVSPFMPPVDTTRYPESLSLADLHLSHSSTSNSESRDGKTTPQNTTLEFKTTSESPSPSSVKLTSPLQINANNSIPAQVSKTTTNSTAPMSTKPNSDMSISGSGRKTVEEIDNSNENNSQSFNDFKSNNSVAQIAATADATSGANLKSSKPTSSGGKVRISLEQPSNSDKQRGNQDLNGRNKIRALLENGKLSHDTSQLFRSLPIFRSNYQSAKLAQMTQSLNRNNFQFLPSSVLSEASRSTNESFANNNKQYSDASQSAVKQTTVSDDQVQVSSQSLMDQIYALDKQRALLLARVQKLKEKQKFYSQRFASVRQKEVNCNSEKDVESVKAEDRLVCSEMERELGVRSEADLQARVESDSSSLQRMDQQLIQLFELFYILEQNNNNIGQSATTGASEESSEPNKTPIDSQAAEVVHFGDSSSKGNAVIKHPETISDSNIGGSGDSPVSYEVHATPRIKDQETHSNSSSASAPTQQVEMMFQFLASFNDKNYEEMSRTFLLMSSAPETCLAMRQAGCLPLLIQLIHCELDATASMSSNNNKTNNNHNTEIRDKKQRNKLKKKTRHFRAANGSSNSNKENSDSQAKSEIAENLGDVMAVEEDADDTVESILCLMEELDANSSTVRQRASESLHNIIHSQAPSKTTNRDIKMLSYLSRIRTYCETICREYCEYLVSLDKQESSSDETNGADVSSSKRGSDQKDGVTFGTKLCSVAVQLKRIDGIVDLVSTLTKLSFIAEELISFQTLGGIPAICELLMVDVGLHHILSKHQQQINSYSSNSSLQMSALCDLSMKLRRHIAELLTNMTHKNQAAKSTLTHYSEVMKCLASQLRSHREDLVHVTADLIRNLAWMPEKSQMMVLRDLNVSILLSEAFVMINNFMALRAISSALWNLSSNCMENRVEICSVVGCLDKMISLLKADLSSNSQSLHVNHQVVYNCSGLLHSLCNHIATRTELREQLRNANVFEVLLDLCKRQDLPDIVINAVSCLYFLSSRDKADQEILWLLGAPNILKDLSNSASVKISSAAHQTRKNLMQAKSQLRGLQSHNAAVSPTFHNSSSTVNRINDGIRKTSEGSESPTQLGGVAKLVRPAVMFDDPAQSQANFASPAINQFGNQSTTSGYATSDSGGQNYPSGFELPRNGFSGSSTAASANDNGLAATDHIRLNRPNGDIAWLKEAYQRRQESNVLEQRGAQLQALPVTKSTSRSTLHSSRKAALMHQMDAGNESFSSYQEQCAVDRQRRTAELQGQQQKINHRQFDEQDKRSVTSSQGDDEVVNYTLKYYGADSQGDLDEEGGDMIEENQPGFTAYPIASNQIEESEYYEQPTDFSVRFPENDAMSTYEELDFSVNSSMSRNIMNNEMNVISNVVGPQAPCFEDVNYEHNEEHNDSMNETLQPQGVINSPAGVYRQVRFKPAIKETVTDISTSSPHGVMLESERRVALPRGPLESVSSSVHQEQDSEGNVSKKGSATGTPLMGDTPLMFSRRSSVSSLGDFETHSITSNSNFASEQGSRAISGAVSPSDIPDSPNEMMMQSRIPPNQGTNSQQQQQVDSGRNFGNPIPSASRTQVNTTSVRDPQQPTHLESSRQPFVSETQGNDFSCASSLSALTFDDEPKVKELAKNFQQFTTFDESTGQEQEVVNLNIPRRLNLKETVNISQDIECNNESISRDWAKQLNKSDQPIANEQTIGRISDDDDSLLLDDDDDVNLRGSNEEDHSVLMEAISSGMPERKPRRPSSKKSNSQSYLKQGSSKMPGKLRQSIPTSSYTSGQSNQQMPYVAKGRQSPGLTRSASGRSLNSVGSGRKSPGPGPKVAGGTTYGSTRPQNTYMDLYMRRMSQTESGVSSPRGAGGNVDTVKVYQTEGTPLNFSTRTSLSDLSVADDVMHSSDLYLTQTHNLQPNNVVTNANTNGKREHAPSNLHPEKSHRLKSWAINSPGAGSVSKYSNATGGFDSPKVYNVEGTPASYSRNDSLSSLSCDEGALDDSALGTAASSRPPPHPQYLQPSLEVPTSTAHMHKKNVSGKSGASKIPVANTYRRRSSNGSSDVEKPDSNSSNSLERKNRNGGQQITSGHVDIAPSDIVATGSSAQGAEISIIEPTEADLSKSFEDEQDDFTNRRRSIGELSNASSGGDVGLEDRALLNECIYSAMPSSARKSSKSSKSHQLQMKSSLETAPTELDNFESNGGDPLNSDSSRRRLNYP